MTTDHRLVLSPNVVRQRDPLEEPADIIQRRRVNKRVGYPDTADRVWLPAPISGS